mgnify:CR=1 FL=1
MPMPRSGDQRFAGPIGSAVLSLVLVLAIGCDPSVDVFDPSDQYRYSLYGTLDVAADTQVIRVEPLADTNQVGSPRAFDGTVRLENLDTGTEVTLRDSLVSLGPGTNVHNFWTTHPIRPATSYRLSVQVDGETVTTGQATTPESPPSATHGGRIRLPCVLNEFDRPERLPNTFELHVSDAEHLAAVHVFYPITLTRGSGPSAPVYDSIRVRYDHLSETRDRSTVPVFYGSDLVGLNDEQNLGLGTGCIPRYRFVQEHVLVMVADGGPDWPHWLGVPINEIARPDTFSNVQGGHGFVGGIYSDTIKVPIDQRR